jgi:hypothetical protein
MNRGCSFRSASQHEQSMGIRQLSQLHLHCQDPAEAISLGERAIALAEATGSTEAHVHALCTVRAAMDATSSRDGRPRLEQSLAFGKVSGYEDPVARSLRPADGWRGLGYPLRTARALMDGDEPAVREALPILEQLGARPDAQIAKARPRVLEPRASRSASEHLRLPTPVG